jgi:hypothetical protein
MAANELSSLFLQRSNGFPRPLLTGNGLSPALSVMVRTSIQNPMELRRFGAFRKKSTGRTHA